MATKFVGGSYLSLPNVLGNVACWYKFWDPTTLEQTIGGGGGNPGNGDPIGRALDQSGNGLHIDAPSTGARPTFETNVNGTAGAALFDGVTSQLQRLTTSNVTANRSQFTILAVVKHTAAPTNRRPYILFTTGANTGQRIEHAASQIAGRIAATVRRRNADTLVRIDSTSLIGTDTTLISTVVNYATDSFGIYFNGALENTGAILGTSGAPTQNTNGRIYVGGQGALFMNGYIFEILCLHAAPTDDELRILWNYMRAQSQIG